MNEEEAIKRHYEVYKTHLVNCSDEQEREFIINLIQPLYPNHKKVHIELALGYSCRNLKEWDLNKILSTINKKIGNV